MEVTEVKKHTESSVSEIPLTPLLWITAMNEILKFKV